MAPPKRSAVRPGASMLQWLMRHQDEVAQADSILAEHMGNPKFFGEHTRPELCEEILSIVRKSVGQGLSADSESGSVLLTGESGTGKTHTVEYCIQQIKEVDPRVVVVRAYGQYYASDVECVRHLAAQVSGQSAAPPRVNASLEAGMEWFHQVLEERFKEASAAVVVLEGFEHFCSRQRQTLLYNLFDTAQNFGVCLSIIGVSTACDVANRLEKRIKSRFSMRHLTTTRLSTIEELIEVLMSKFRLVQSGSNNKNAFTRELLAHVDFALRARAKEWEHLLETQPPAWFMWKCLPLHAFLKDAASREEQAANSNVTVPPPKRARLNCVHSFTDTMMQRDVLEGLSQAELLILLALFRIEDRGRIPTLGKALFEIQTMHRTNPLDYGFSEDFMTTCFLNLVAMDLVKVEKKCELVARDAPCECDVRLLGALVADLERSTPTLSWSPLRALPQSVQQWVGRQRK